MPEHVVPMFAKLGHLPPNDDDYGFEIKWDGYRAVAYVTDGAVRFESRRLLDMTGDYPELAGLGPALAGHRAVLDGEIVVLDPKGRPRFQLIQRHLQPAVYMIFDVLYMDGRTLMDEAYVARREVLEELGLRAADERWRVPEYHHGGGAQLLAAASQQGLEGLVAKRLDSRYLPGQRPGTWLKVKQQQRQELVIGGYTPGEGRRHGQVGALVLGYYDDDGRFTYAGKVGTGFAQRDLDELGALLQPLRRPTSPYDVGKPPRDAVFVEPELVGEFEFTEWTEDGTLRHPPYKGLRKDKLAREVVRETPD